MIVLGCDAGDANCGLCILDVGPIVRPLWRDVVPFAGIRDVLRAVGPRFAVETVGIEQPEELYAHSKIAKDAKSKVQIQRDIMAARGAAGAVEMACGFVWPDARVFRGEAHDVRKVLGRMPRAPRGKSARTFRDKVVAAAVRQRIPGWDDLIAPNNSHTRDAAVAALWAAVRARMPEAVIAAPKRRRRAA